MGGAIFLLLLFCFSSGEWLVFSVMWPTWAQYCQGIYSAFCMFECLVLECELLTFTSSHCREHSELTCYCQQREFTLWRLWKCFYLSGIFLAFSCLFLKSLFWVWIEGPVDKSSYCSWRRQVWFPAPWIKSNKSVLIHKIINFFKIIINVLFSYITGNAALFSWLLSYSLVF